MCIRDRIEPACPSGGPAVVVTPHAHRRRGNRYSTRRRTISTSHVCDQPAPASTAPPRPAPHPRHRVGGATGSTLSGSSSRARPWPSWPGCPPRSRSGDRSRDETSLSRARRCALRVALAWIDSFDDGVPESSLPIPNRRSNSAIRNPCPATIVRSSAFSVSFADRNAAISASLAATTSRSRALARRSRSNSDTSGTSDMTRDHRHWPAEIKHPTRRRVAQPPQVGTTPEWTRVLADVGGKDFDDGGLVSRRVAHQSFEGVDAAEPHLDLVGAKLLHGFGVPVGEVSFSAQPVGTGG